MAFNKKEYDINYIKKNKKQFKVDLNLGEYLKNKNILEIKQISNVDFIRKAFKKIEEELNMKEKIELIDKMIDGIIENAVNAYLNEIDENNSMSISDWKAGCHGTLKNCDGNIMKYIPYSGFKELYSNFKNDLHNHSLVNNEVIFDLDEKTADKIIKYLEEEAKYTNYNDLDRECYCLDDFIR